jgi:hypothetical protein
MLKELPKKVPDMDILDYELLMLIKDMAGTMMTKEEVLATFTIPGDDLSEEEEVFFNEFYNYGRGMAIHKVGQNLVDSTKGRQGQAAAMSFLRRFAKEFESEIEGDKNGSFSFQFGAPQ